MEKLLLPPASEVRQDSVAGPASLQRRIHPGKTQQSEVRAAAPQKLPDSHRH